MKLFIIFTAVILFLLILLTVASFVALGMMTHNIKRKSKASKERALDADILFGDKISEGVRHIQETPFEEWQIKSFDGLSLYGRYFKNGDSKKTIILLHGFRSSGEHDFSCAFKMYFDHGFNILIPDQRAHGKSEGKYICYGVLERYDALGWIEKVITEKGDDEKIYLSGVSMGASTALMASGLSLPKNVCGIIADCGFTSPSEIIKKVMREDMGFPLFPVFYTTRLLVKLVAKFDLDYSCLDALKTNDIPMLFIHGTADNFVPFYMGEQNFEGCKSEKSSIWVDKAGHGTSFLFETERCVKALEEFTSKYL